MKPKYTLAMRVNNALYDLKCRDLLRKRARCVRFLHEAFGTDMDEYIPQGRVAEYISEAEFGEYPWTDFFNVRWRPWAIDYATLARDFILWLHNTEEYEEQEREYATKEAEQYYAYTGLRL